MIDIEKVTQHGSRSKAVWHEFLETLKELKAGESFVLKRPLSGNHRMAMAIGKVFLNATFSGTKEGDDQYRVTRTA